jgi:hypothetical protein
MAGSWQHMTTGTGRLRNNESFCGMAENLGDAYEAAEECYGMVWYLAARIAEVRGPGRPSRGEVLAVIREAEARYKEGLKLGGVQRDR